jgi:glyoxylate/hydroxypyruvate reductase A
VKIVVCAGRELAEVSARELGRHLPSAEVAVHLNSELVAADVVANADYAVVWTPPPRFFAGCRKLKAVFALGAGVDALLARPDMPVDLPLIRLEDAGMAQPMADYVLAAILRVYRRFDTYAERQRRRRWQQETMVPKQAYRVGVLGLGAIGGEVASTLARYGFAVRGCARSLHAIPGVQCFAADSGFDAFLDQLDVLVNVLPLTADNRGILDRSTLSRLADGAHLINVGRGAHLVEADLLALLDNGKIAAATLDVFAQEPLPDEHPFWQRPEILITPHAAAVTEDEPAYSQIARKIAALERGEPVGGIVDRERGY